MGMFGNHGAMQVQIEAVQCLAGSRLNDFVGNALVGYLGDMG